MTSSAFALPTFIYLSDELSVFAFQLERTMWVLMETIVELVSEREWVRERDNNVKEGEKYKLNLHEMKYFNL